jgi:hypothetical protein
MSQQYEQGCFRKDDTGGNLVVISIEHGIKSNRIARKTDIDNSDCAHLVESNISSCLLAYALQIRMVLV